MYELRRLDTKLWQRKSRRISQTWYTLSTSFIAMCRL